jgi:hypothetical protein
MSLIHLELLVPVVQLILEVVDIVLGDNQLILSVLQLCTGIIKEVGLDVTAVVRPHQLIIQLFDTHLKVVVLLEELSVFLLDVFDEVGLGVHLVVILLHASVLVGASHRDLLKHGAYVLGVACRERSGAPTATKCSLHAALPSFQMGNKATTVLSRPDRWRSQNSMRAWWAARSRVSSRSSLVAVMNQTVMLGSEG